MQLDEIKQQIREWIHMNYIKPEDIPSIELYMDQVTTFMGSHINIAKEDDKVMTKTMINNYTKNKLLPPPVKKKYSREHIILLIYIYYLKNFLTIADIDVLLKPLTEEFFAGEAPEHLALSDIYKEIVDMELQQHQTSKQAIYDTIEKSKKTFQNLPEETPQKFRDYLQTFSFISMLAYDIYAKKQVIEHLIQEMATEHTPVKTDEE